MAAIDAGSSLIKESDDEKVRFPRGDLVWKMCQAMITRRKEIVFFLVLLLTVYAAIHTGPLKTKKAAFPTPFFPLHSLVVDHFWGDVYQAFEGVQHSDVTFIMFYAPWDSTSMDVRWEFEKTAHYYRNQVNFAAVNCWWPNGECQQHFPKIRNFPLLIAYHSNGKGIAFHGTPTFPYLVRFLELFINPINVIHEKTDLFNLLAKRDAVVLGYFEFGASYMPSGFLTFYTAALKALEKDPEHITAFAVVSNIRDASKFNLNTSGSIDLHLWNGKLTYHVNGTLSSQKLLNWVSHKKSQVIKWISLPRVKSHRLAAYLEAVTPTLVMLTPRFVTAELERSPYFYMLKEVALDYFNCNHSFRIEDTIRVIKNHVRTTSFDVGDLSSDCRNILRSDCNLGYIAQCCVSVQLSIQSSHKMFSVCIISARNVPTESMCKMLNDKLLLERQWNHSGCQIGTLKYSSYHYLRVCYYEHSDEIRSHSVRCSSRSIYKCNLISHSDVHPGMPVPKERAYRKTINITSQGCQTNRTLNFVALDSSRYGFLFEKIGVKLSSTTSRTAVAIIHAKQEMYYVLNKDLTIQNLREFIVMFTKNELQRYQRSLTSSELRSNSSEEKMAVIEVTSESFNDVVINTSKDVVVLVYAPWCASCFSMYHIYLSVARYFQSSNNIIFTRINGDANDLPWEFTVQNYPSVLLFPGYRKSESASFPIDMALTTKNLIHFVLAHAQEKVKLHTVFNLCSNLCVTHNRRLAGVKISNLLKDYRLLIGQLSQNVKAIEQQCANTTIPQMIPSYVANAKYLAQQLCGVRAKLVNAKSLHFKLSTDETHQISRKHMDEIINDYNSFSNRSFTESGCEDFVSDLNREVDRCPQRLVKSSLLWERNTL